LAGSLFFVSKPSFATNGDNLIGIGPASKSMGGVGIACPQDAISSIFSNPATMSFSPYNPGSQFDFAGTVFVPSVEGSVEQMGQLTKAQSDKKAYAIPAIGFSIPLGDEENRWRMGLAAYGVTGLGVDYRATDLDNAKGFDFSGGAGTGPFAPLIAGEYTSLQIMKFALAVSYKLNPQISFGLSTHLNYSSLDLRGGSSFNYAFGVQPGVVYSPIENLSLGLTYSMPQNVTHSSVTDFNQDGKLDNMDLESPQQLGFGAAYRVKELNLLIEANAKWINWSGAKGYKEFDWNDQWVFNLGAQYQPISGLSIRAGYNYGKNPLKVHNGWDGSFNPGTGAPNSVNDVQGVKVPTYYYETFRIIGFPAIVEQHLTFGLGYQFSEKLGINFSYVHAFENTITESGSNPFGMPVKLKSTLSENSFSFAMSYKF
ncbi:MAG: hypothetical protein HGB19_03630, partial [Chlorobiales bacterium]|nr:hypothetical protein [Chlorobiales bacterium]